MLSSLIIAHLAGIKFTLRAVSGCVVHDAPRESILPASSQHIYVAPHLAIM